MRFLSVFIKSVREQFRNLLVLALTLVFAPVFVFAYWLFFPAEGSTAYRVLIINEDAGVQIDGQTYHAGEEVTNAIARVTYASGSPLLTVRQVASFTEAEALLRDRNGVVYLFIPEDFSRQLAAKEAGDPSATTELVFGGDLTNPYYPIAAILATSAVDSYVQQAAGTTPPVQYVEQPLGGSGSRTEFETYVPGMFIFAVMMLVFAASMTVAREVENGTLRRLQITRMTAFDLLGGTSLTLVIVGVAAEMLAFGTAMALGFRSYGPLWVAVLVGAVTSVSVIGVGMIVAAFSRSVSQAFVIANFPLGVFMFLSGAVFPIPSVTLFEIAGQPIGLCDFLPPRHAVVALNKILTLGAGLEEVVYELVALVVLSLLYFAIGTWVFQRRHLRPA
ncbi:MAG: ABC transporter permease [Anaerolineae bacterium]|nr:ABC transporter permease [Anaerolineae bacterium]